MQKNESEITSIIGMPARKWNQVASHLTEKDKKLGKAIDKVGPFKLAEPREKSLFASLVRSIVYQQLNGRAAASIYQKFLKRFETEDCPTAKEISKKSDPELKECGLSRSKLAAIRDLSEHQMHGLIPNRDEAIAMDDAEIIEKVTRVRGIGLWTAQMLLIFDLGRPDILPCTDYGVRKGFQLLFTPSKVALPDQKTMEKRARRWQPYRSIASWYLWRIQD